MSANERFFRKPRRRAPGPAAEKRETARAAPSAGRPPRARLAGPQLTENPDVTKTKIGLPPGARRVVMRARRESATPSANGTLGARGTVMRARRESVAGVGRR